MEKICANTYPTKDEYLLQKTLKGKTNSITKWAKDMKRHFKKEDYKHGKKKAYKEMFILISH